MKAIALESQTKASAMIAVLREQLPAILQDRPVLIAYSERGRTQY